MYLSPNIVSVTKSRELRGAGYIFKMEEGRSAFEILPSTPRENIPLRRPRCRWEDNIIMDLKEIYMNTRYWVNLVEGRALVNLRVP